LKIGSYKTNLKNHKLLFAITLLYFVLGFVNIHFALLGLVCMALPFYLLFRDNKKTWCQGYCPRANLYGKSAKIKGKSALKTPIFFVKGNMKWIMLGYFMVSLTFIILSTIRVGSGGMPPMESLRFLIVIPIKFEMPQLTQISGSVNWLTHLSYRFYSMMMTTTVIGIALALIYKPRTWCVICPIATTSDLYLNQKKRA